MFKKFNKQALSQSKYLKFIKKYLDLHYLWDSRPSYVARGASIGAFWSLIIPIAQIPVSAVFCIILRGNLIAASIFTLPANPVTYPFIIYGYYHIGQWVLNFFALPNSQIALVTITGGGIVLAVIIPIVYLVGYLIGFQIQRLKKNAK